MASSISGVKKVTQAPADRARLERRALELAKECPLDRANPLVCPLYGLRPLSAHERHSWVRGLTDEELEYLASYHSCCMAEKIATERR